MELHDHGGKTRSTLRFGLVAIDVLTQIEIARPRAEVAEYAGDPDNAPRW